MIASLRFSGLKVNEGSGSRPASRNLAKVLFDAPERSRCTLWRDGLVTQCLKTPEKSSYVKPDCITLYMSMNITTGGRPHRRGP